MIGSPVCVFVRSFIALWGVSSQEGVDSDAIIHQKDAVGEKLHLREKGKRKGLGRGLVFSLGVGLVGGLGNGKQGVEDDLNKEGEEGVLGK